MLSIANSVSLVIDDAGNSTFKARFVGQGCEVECGVGKGVVMAVRAEVAIVVEEEVLDKAGITTKA